MDRQLSGCFEMDHELLAQRIDSVHYSYPIWKRCYFVVDPRYPIQNNPQEVIHLCLLGSSAIKTCSEFFKNLGVKASWRSNSSWETALDALSSNNTERFKAAPNMDTYLTISHYFRMELGSKSDKKGVLEGHLEHLGFSSRYRNSSGHFKLDALTIGGPKTADPRGRGDDNDKRYLIGLIRWRYEPLAEKLYTTKIKQHVELILDGSSSDDSFLEIFKKSTKNPNYENDDNKCGDESGDKSGDESKEQEKRKQKRREIGPENDGKKRKEIGPENDEKRKQKCKEIGPENNKKKADDNKKKNKEKPQMDSNGQIT
jgi:hypothetical protein